MPPVQKQSVESWIAETMNRWDEATVEPRTSAVCAMTLLPPATLLQHLPEKAKLVGMVEDGVHPACEDEGAPDRLAEQICECLAKLPEEYHERVGKDLVVCIQDRYGEQQHATDRSKGAARLFRCMPPDLFDKHAPQIVRLMVYGKDPVVVECATVLMGRAGYDNARIASMVKALMLTDTVSNYSFKDLLTCGLPHALGEALPREVLVHLSDYLIKRLFEMDNSFFGVVLRSEAERMGEVLAKMEPQEIMPYLPDLIKPPELRFTKSESRRGELPVWRAPVLARLPYAVLEPYFPHLVSFIAAKDAIHRRLLPIYRQFPPPRYGAVVDAYVGLLGTKKELYLYNMCARSELVNLPLFRALELLDDASLTSSSLRAAAALSRVMDMVKHILQECAWSP